jgi:hypothetical protein
MSPPRPCLYQIARAGVPAAVVRPGEELPAAALRGCTDAGPAGPDDNERMETDATTIRWIEVECLACGERRLTPGRARPLSGACGRCGYLGWARPAEIDDRERAAVRHALADARPLLARAHG